MHLMALARAWIRSIFFLQSSGVRRYLFKFISAFFFDRIVTGLFCFHCLIFFVLQILQNVKFRAWFAVGFRHLQFVSDQRYPESIRPAVQSSYLNSFRCIVAIASRTRKSIGRLERAFSSDAA